MARVHYESPVSHITGALQPHGIINRRKQFRDDNGKVVHQGNPEAYKVKNPRDYSTNPPKGAELAHLKHFGEAARRTTKLLRIARRCKADVIDLSDNAAIESVLDKYPRHIVALQAYFDYKARYLNQLGRTADPQAPVDATGKRRRYYRLDNFIRAMLYHEKRSARKAGR